MVDETEARRKTRVFISYSRKDQALLERLSSALTDRGFFTDFDLGGDADKIEGGIAPSDQWRTRLKAMIAAADVIVFVVSPSSAASPVCDWEIGEAQALAKRIIPIIGQHVHFSVVPQRLAGLNVVISFEPALGEATLGTAQFESALDRLIRAINIDIGWLREQRRLVELAIRWNENGRPDAQLLRTGEISAAESWTARRPDREPSPPELLFAFLAESRRKEEQDRARLEQSEHSARLQAGDAWFERALVHLENAERHHACECLLKAVSVASPNAIPSGYNRTLKDEGWASRARTLGGCLAAGLPRQIACYPFADFGCKPELCTWFDEGNLVLVAAAGAIHAYRIKHGDWTEIARLADKGKVVALAGASGAARACALYDTGELRMLDFASWIDRSLSVAPDATDIAIALNHTATKLLVARRETTAAIARLFDWDDGKPGLEIVLGRGEKDERWKPRWAGFSHQGEKFGVVVEDHLRVFNEAGAPTASLGVRRSSGPIAVAPDLSGVASANYDLVVVRRALEEEQFGTNDGTSDPSKTPTEDIILEGAESLIGNIVFLQDCQTLLTTDHGGNVLEWRLAQATERGMTAGEIKITERFGRSNRVRPSNHFEGLSSISALSPHPKNSKEVLLFCDDKVRHVQLSPPDQPFAVPPSLGPAARVVVGEDGTVAVATESGVRHFTIAGQHVTDPDIVGPEGTVWDVAVHDGLLAAAYAGGEVKVWEIPEFAEMASFRFEETPRALAFAAGRLFVGLEDGVLWEWPVGNDPERVGALGVGPITRIRISADERLGVAVGRRDADLDNGKPDEYNLHGGLVAWNIAERLIVWSSDGFNQPLDIDLGHDGSVLFLADSSGEALALDPWSGAVLGGVRPPQSDPSKPSQVTAICAGPDDRMAYLGLWDGSIALADLFSQRVYTLTKAHEKYVSSISADRSRGLVFSTSPIPMSADNVAVWRGWDPDFFRGNPVAADWSDHLMANFEDCYGAFNLDQAGVRSLRSFDISPVTDFDDIARGREMLIRDSKYSADLFARAIRSGRETELSPDEMFLAGQSFRESGDTERGRRLIDEAAQAGVSEASVALGLEALGAGRDLEEWAPALPYFRAAAGAGHAHAAFLLGYYYDRMVRAEVGEVDWRALARPTQPGPAEPGEAERQAQHWYEIAAEQGHPRAKARLQESA